MEPYLIKAGYVLLGLVIGYIVGRLRTDTTEKRLALEIRAGKQVMVAVDNSAVIYKMKDGHIITMYGQIDIMDITEGNDALVDNTSSN